MPKFEIPAFGEGPEQVVTDGNPIEVTLYIPANEEILDALDIDQEVVVTLNGKVIGLESADQEYNRPEFKFKVKSVEVKPVDNEYGELADDD